MKFGSLPIDSNQDLVIKQLLDFLNNYLERPHLYEHAPAWLRELSPNGTLTSGQWEIVDIFAKPKNERPTLMEVVEQLGKRSTSSITKPRDMARRKILESILTLTYVLQDPNILIYFLGEFIYELNEKRG